MMKVANNENYDEDIFQRNLRIIFRKFIPTGTPSESPPSVVSGRKRLPTLFGRQSFFASPVGRVAEVRPRYLLIATSGSSDAMANRWLLLEMYSTLFATTGVL